jgi:hypothetical protein
MPRKTAYRVKLRQLETGEVHDRLIFAVDETIAKKRAVERARMALRTTMVERQYGRFEVLSCAPEAGRLS